jgi:hypothetical protein
MPANANRDRAVRRSQARRQRPADLIGVPEGLDEMVPNDPEMAAQSPVAGPESPSTPPNVSRAATANLSRRRGAGIALPQTSAAGPLALPDEDLTRQLGMGDLVVPKVRISQAMSKTNMLNAQTRGREGVGMGSWYHTTTGKNLGEVIYFVPVDMRKSRAMFVQGQGLVCRSFDLLQGEGDPGILCEGTLSERQTLAEDQRGCEYRLWERTDQGNRPPPCGMTYNYPGLILVDVENPEGSEILQAMLQLRSTATGAAKIINTGVLSYADSVWHNAIFELRVESKTNTRGIFFVPVAEYYDSTESPEYTKVHRRAAAFARQMGSANLRSSIEADPEND